MANQKKNQVKRNERERKRVHQVNDGFDLLRTRLRANATPNKKLSKADTLREAVKYIRHLQTLLGESPDMSYPTTSTFFHVKEEFDAYFPPTSAQYPNHPQHQQQLPPIQAAHQHQYTSPTSSVASYSPPQTYYSSPYHQPTHQHTP